MNPTLQKHTEVKLFLHSFIPALKLLRSNDPLRLAGATAFFTTFALPPIIFILAQLFGLLTSPKFIGMGLLDNLSKTLGEQGAQQVRGVILSIRDFSKDSYVIIPGFIFLLFVATTLFKVIKNSFEQLWDIRENKIRGFLISLGSRLKSVAVILFVGILFIAELMLRSLEALSGEYIEKLFGGSSIYFRIVFSEITAAIMVSAWFMILFRFLTQSRPPWKACIVGGLLTGILFIGGRSILKVLLVDGNIGTLYGASGSLVLVLLFVFYTSFILYFGACFVKIYSGEAL